MKLKPSWVAFAAGLHFIAVLTTIANGSANEQLIITADNIVNRVCVDGQDKSSFLRNNKKIPKFDHIPLVDPENGVTSWNYTTVEGTNLGRGWAGFLAWQTATTPTALAKWHCMPMSDVPNGDCCSVAKDDPGWRPSRDWYRVNGHHNRDYKSKVPSQVTHWFWSSKIKQKHVCCIVQRCDNVCKRCILPGLGNCIECMFGTTSAPNPTNPAQMISNVCKFKCCVFVQAEQNVSYVTISTTNMASLPPRKLVHENNTFHGVYWIDIEECRIGNKKEAQTNAEDGGSIMSTFNNWRVDPALKNFVGIEVRSGQPYLDGFATFIDVERFPGDASQVSPYANNLLSSIKFCINEYTHNDPNLQPSDFEWTPSEMPLILQT